MRVRWGPLLGIALVAGCFDFGALGGGDDSTANDAGADAQDASTGTESSCVFCGPNNTLKLGAGDSFACLLRGGSVWCWGTNEYGQLALGPDGDQLCGSTACRGAGLVPGIEDAVDIAVGNTFACVVRSDATVWCWGGNNGDCLGHDPSGDPKCNASAPTPCDRTPSPVTGLSDVAHIFAGEFAACAILRTGETKCWGNNTFGLLGTGTAGGPTFTPQSVVGLSHPTDLSLSLISGHACAVQDGKALCWGPNGGGEIGHDPSIDPTCVPGSPVRCAATPTEVDDDAGVLGTTTQITSGLGASCALSSAGTVSCWGSNLYGMLANPAPGSTYALAVDAAAPTTLIAGLWTHECVIEEAGTACWGESDYGGCGPSPDGGALLVKVPSPTLVGKFRAKQLATGANFTVALGVDDQVYAWGDNADGRLGHPSGSNGDTTCAAGRACHPAPIVVPFP